MVYIQCSISYCSVNDIDDEMANHEIRFNILVMLGKTKEAINYAKYN